MEYHPQEFIKAIGKLQFQEYANTSDVVGSFLKIYGLEDSSNRDVCSSQSVFLNISTNTEFNFSFKKSLPKQKNESLNVISKI